MHFRSPAATRTTLAYLRTFLVVSVLLVAACDPGPPPLSVASVPYPLLNPDGDQQGSEGASWRIAAASDTSIVLLLRPNDLRGDGTPVPHADQTASLVELHLPDGPVDTLRTLPGTPVQELETVPGFPPRFGEDLYAARPILAAGDDWIAWTHGDSTSVEIQGSSELRLQRVEWPAGSRPISDELKRTGARWELAGHMMNSTYSRDLAESMSAAEIEEGIRMHAFDLLSFPLTAPSVTAMTGHGRCLFIAGFQPIDNPFGIAATWIVVDTGTGVLERVLRFLPPPDAANYMNVRGVHVRAVVPPVAYAVY